MHQSRNTLVSTIVLCIFACLLSVRAQAQLNRHDEIIEGVQDIDLQDDTRTDDTSNKTQNDEEFQKKQLSPEQQVEDEIKNQEQNEQTDTKAADDEADQYAPRKEVKEQHKTYEDQLKESEEKNIQKVQEDMNSPDNGFEVDKENATAKPEQTEQAPPPQNAQKQQKAQTAPEDDMQGPEEVAAPVGESGNIEEAPSQTTRGWRGEKTQKQTSEQDYEPGQSNGDSEERIYTSGTEDRPIFYETAPLQTEKHLSDSEREKLSRETKVDIEADDDTKVQVVREKTNYNMSFRDRRPPWTTELELGENRYQPYNYDSNIVTNQSSDATYKGLYGTPNMPMLSLALDFKKNFSFGAISLGISGAYFRASGANTKLSLIIPTARANFYLDNLFKEPYVVPYAAFGDSVFMYKEHFDAGTGSPEDVNGKTDAFYAGFGLLFQLDWMDPSTNAISHEETGIENTFVFIEGRTYLNKGIIHKASDPDFSSGLTLASGLKFEF